jgi:hypothetical protein
MIIFFVWYCFPSKIFPSDTVTFWGFVTIEQNFLHSSVDRHFGQLFQHCKLCFLGVLVVVSALGIRCRCWYDVKTSVWICAARWELRRDRSGQRFRTPEVPSSLTLTQFYDRRLIVNYRCLSQPLGTD